MIDHSAPTQYDPSSPGGVQSRLILVLFIASGVLLAVILAATEAAYNYVEDHIKIEDSMRGHPELESKIAQQEARLATPARIVGDDQHVIVPVQYAIEDYLARQEKKKQP